MTFDPFADPLINGAMNDAMKQFYGDKAPDPARTRLVKCTFIRDMADKLVKEKKYKDASATYIMAAAALIGRDLPIQPNGPFHLPEYEQLEPAMALQDMMLCLNNTAESLVKLRRYKEVGGLNPIVKANIHKLQALWFTSEVEVVVRNVQIESTRANPSFEWFDFSLQLSEFYLQRLRARVTTEKIFRQLGNTGSANERNWHCTTLVPKHLETPEIRKIHPIIQLNPIYKLRHPDPTLVASLTVTDPTLQVLGSWQKVQLKKAGGITSRMGFASFVFEGHLYIMGGEKYLSGPLHRDFWYIDLSALDEWRPLPGYPVPEYLTGKLTGYSMVVNGECAYLFTGRKDVDVFHLRTHTWSSIRTSVEGSQPWPYPRERIVDYAMQCVRGKIYVFGGTHDLSQVGCNLLMELDIASRTWTRLSGTAQPTRASYAGPGPRSLACSWVGKDQNTLYILYGVADRQAAMLANQAHGAENSYANDDLWSWDIAACTWTRRRLIGNTPAPRTEMACTYNAALDKVITFGGYTPTCPSHFARDTVFVFTYYGDTFMYGTDAGGAAASWKHVLTRGFPTYRAQAQLVSDHTTGRTFLFGGYVNSEYVPSRSKETSRSFADLWELRLSVPGGHFADVDVEDEARTARAGPWQRCFTCGSAGPWKKCGGACNGQAFFCDARCLRDGWKEHKLKHKCSK
ncbi:hypothetical protein MVEN_02401300 [Mycena venus]|uniref:MYND-type domain-containing protein n=1 Tax=Mycena venus TaxID=2733690 RepID=A0A8H6X2A5_9AGAR|nr:hypothetical protein MVEN_02401300 [Mycena venus]